MDMSFRLKEIEMSLIDTIERLEKRLADIKDNGELMNMDYFRGKVSGLELALGYAKADLGYINSLIKLIGGSKNE